MKDIFLSEFSLKTHNTSDGNEYSGTRLMVEYQSSSTSNRVLDTQYNKSTKLYNSRLY
jgi:hypothetical protein